MKILHTSDWHLGHTFYGHDRHDEQAAVIDAVIDIAAAEQPDAVLVSGDVFDSAQPPNRAYKMFVDKIDRLACRCPNATVVITAGNHDSAARHELFSTPWRRGRVLMAGNPAQEDEDPAKLIALIAGRGAVAACPFVHPRFLEEDFFKKQTALAAEAAGDLPVVLMAHLAVRGCDATAHGEMIGDQECVDSDLLGKDYDYCALGHIHRPQWVGVGRRLRYCGTPMAVSFDEPPVHTVSIVEIDRRGAEPRLREVEIPQPVRALTVPGEGYAPLDEVLGYLTDFPADIPAYLRLRVCGHGALPIDAAARVARTLEGKKARFCLFQYKNLEEINRDEAPALGIEDFMNLAPISLARRYADAAGLAFDHDMEELFNTVSAEIQKVQ